MTLGRISLEWIAADQGEQARLLFDSARLTPGIGAIGDPMLDVRSVSYRIPLVRRTSGESLSDFNNVQEH